MLGLGRVSKIGKQHDILTLSNPRRLFPSDKFSFMNSGSHEKYVVDKIVAPPVNCWTDDRSGRSESKDTSCKLTDLDSTGDSGPKPVRGSNKLRLESST